MRFGWCGRCCRSADGTASCWAHNWFTRAWAGLAATSPFNYIVQNPQDALNNYAFKKFSTLCDTIRKESDSERASDSKNVNCWQRHCPCKSRCLLLNILKQWKRCERRNSKENRTDASAQWKKKLIPLMIPRIHNALFCTWTTAYLSKAKSYFNSDGVSMRHVCITSTPQFPSILNSVPLADPPSDRKRIMMMKMRGGNPVTVCMGWSLRKTSKKHGIFKDASDRALCSLCCAGCWSWANEHPPLMVGWSTSVKIKLHPHDVYWYRVAHIHKTHTWSTKLLCNACVGCRNWAQPPLLLSHHPQIIIRPDP